MALWMDLCIDLKSSSKPIWQNDFRSIIAKQNADEPDDYWKLDEEIFHYQNGQPNTDPFPLFRLTTTNNGKTGHVYAVGPGVEYLMANGHKISRFMGKHLGRPIAEHRYTGNYEVYERPHVSRYFISTLVFQRSRKDYQEFKDAAKAGKMLPSMALKIETLIEDGIHLHLDNLGIYIEDFILGEIEAEQFMSVDVKKNRYFLAARNVTFNCSLNIKKGVFHVGYLKGRGYGRITKSLKRETSNVAAS